MPLPDFELLPHELPPASTEPLCAPANARIEVEGQEVLLRVVKVEKGRYVVFLRRDGENLILHCPSSKTTGVMIWKEPPKPRKLERIGRYVQQKQLFFPCHFLVVSGADNAPRAAIVVTRANIHTPRFFYSGHWLRADLSRGFLFSVENKGDLLLSLQKAVENPDSQVNQSWQLQHLTPEERAAYHERKRVERGPNQPKNRAAKFWKGLLGLD